MFEQWMAQNFCADLLLRPFSQRCALSAKQVEYTYVHLLFSNVTPKFFSHNSLYTLSKLSSLEETS